MPRILHVTFTKEFEATIVADSVDELKDALDDLEDEFDDWSNNERWQVNIQDPLRNFYQVETIPTKFSEPDMGVVDGECLEISDYKRKRPDYMNEVEREALEVVRRLTAEKLNLKLFP